MRDPWLDRRPSESRPSSPPDEAYADGFAEGYSEGLREAFKEILQHASRGHTAQELRLLVESRLSRIPEDVEVKRKGLLAPPRRPSWGPLLRPPGANAAGTLPALGPVMMPGKSSLFLEARPKRALSCVAASHARFPVIVALCQFPPELVGVPESKLEVIRFASAQEDPTLGTGALNPSQALGRVRSAVERGGGVLVYLDALEFLVTEYTANGALQFVNWLTAQVANSPNGLVVSTDPAALDGRDLSRLQRSFNILG
ncbi:MAG: hypothetical protein WCA77_10315 [Thermoplasmata archaeon]